jgi:hypothetical protein
MKSLRLPDSVSDVYKSFTNFVHLSSSLSYVPLRAFLIKERKKESKMEHISDDDLLNILERVAVSGVKNFLRFRETSSRHWRLAKTHEVLRALPKNCLTFLTDPKPCVREQILIQHISDSGHPAFCVA